MTVLKRLSGRVADSVDRAAAGAAVPAGFDAGEPAGRAPRARDRGRARRRLRRVRRVRDALLIELGALMLELRRQGREAPELVTRKLDELAAVDAEERAVARALGHPEAVAAELWTEGSACTRCAAALATGSRFCSSCGTAVPAVPAAPGDDVVGPATAPAARAAGDDVQNRRG